MALLKTPDLYDPTGKLYEQRVAPIIAGVTFDVDANWIATRPGSKVVQAAHKATALAAHTAYDTLHAANLVAQAALSDQALTDRQAADATAEAPLLAAITAAEGVVTTDDAYNTALAVKFAKLN